MPSAPQFDEFPAITLQGSPTMAASWAVPTLFRRDDRGTPIPEP